MAVTMEKLDEKIIRDLEMETGIVASKVKDDLNIIRNWVNQQPHLPTLEDNDETNDWLYRYLFYSKNRIEKVKKHLDVYFTCKSLMPEFYDKRDPEAAGIKANVQVLHLFTLPKLTPEGYRVHVFSHSVPDPSVYEPDDFMRRLLMVCDWKMKKDLTAGEIIIFYLKYTTLSHWTRYNLTTLSRFVAAATQAYPLRVKAVHFVQAPSFFSRVINSPFITAKLKQRIKVHSNENTMELLKEIPEYCLPKELGGSLEMTMDELNDSTYKNILEMREWFIGQEKMKSDESKRPPHLKDNNLFCCDGTFRSLDFD